VMGINEDSFFVLLDKKPRLDATEFGK